MRDISERKFMEKALRESETKYRTLYESSADAIMMLDEKGFFDCNNATLQMFGISTKEEFTKLHPSQLSPPYQPDGVDSSTAANDKISEAMKRGSNFFEWTHRRENGEDFFADVMLTSLTIGGKQVLQATVRNVSERKRDEEMILKLNTDLEQRVSERTQQLEESNKELESFAYVVSHDLKAPLRAITSLSNWLVSDYGDKLGEEGKESLNLIVQRSKRMDGLINGILNYSRVGRVTEEAKLVELNTIVNDAITLVSPPVHVEVTVETKLPTIICDQTRIYELFQNLLSNAVKYMDKPEGEIRVGCVDNGRLYTFYVTDNGPGIEEKYFDKIFQMFQTLNPRDEVEGTGVGLTIVKKIVEMYGGTIWVESRIGEGSTFRFTLPYVAEKATDYVVNDLIPPVGGGGGRIITGWPTRPYAA